MDEYEKMLKRGLSKIPKSVSSGERFEIPRMSAMKSGSRTVMSNFCDVANKLRRDPSHLLKFLLKELATSGEVTGKKLEVLGNHSEDVVNRKLENYVKMYVICRECGKPDTKIIKEKGFTFLKCEACGARHTVSKV
jgi:translation initiation factor 2 subunit 2